ncbi:unnamed protein product [Vicia faba]|uniref:Reverse transcriptase domain-containing protein n=1 Tax=Vicia faba TaxID=3906 RepID=A0AAV0ZDM1_VICFA|nr:unnamed protein product [Vicia faba]
MMTKASSVGEYGGFWVGNDLYFEIFQFADDTMLLGDSSWRNLWSIKVILRGFKLVSCLHINLSKNIIMGIHVQLDFLQAASIFPYFEIELPFFYFLLFRWEERGVEAGCFED